MPRAVKFIKTESRTVVVRDEGEEGIRSYRLMGTELQYGMIKSSFRDGTVVMLAQKCQCTLCHITALLKMVKRVNFCYAYFTTLKNKNLKTI